MQVFLSKQCLSLTGMLGRGYGYFLVNRKGHFYSQRSKHEVPPDGHWRFIVLCAELAQNRLHISEIRVKPDELIQALQEARLFVASQNVKLPFYYARDILNFKTTFGL